MGNPYLSISLSVTTGVVAMSSVAILIAASTLGIDYGWQRADDGRIEYIIQIEPQLFERMRENSIVITSDVAAQLSRVDSFRIQIGTGELPQEELPRSGEVSTAVDFEANQEPLRLQLTDAESPIPAGKEWEPQARSTETAHEVARNEDFREVKSEYLEEANRRENAAAEVWHQTEDLSHNQEWYPETLASEPVIARQTEPLQNAEAAAGVRNSENLSDITPPENAGTLSPFPQPDGSQSLDNVVNPNIDTKTSQEIQSEETRQEPPQSLGQPTAILDPPDPTTPEQLSPLHPLETSSQNISSAADLQDRAAIKRPVVPLSAVSILLLLSVAANLFLLWSLYRIYRQYRDFLTRQRRAALTG